MSAEATGGAVAGPGYTDQARRERIQAEKKRVLQLKEALFGTTAGKTHEAFQAKSKNQPQCNPPKSVERYTMNSGR